MILIDTAIWVDHLSHANPTVLNLLAREEVLMHPFVLGEIALGFLGQRDLILTRLGKLPFAETADDNEVINLIKTRQMYGTDIGFVDAHLVASCLLTAGTYLWTRDRRLAAVAERLGVDATTA